MNTLSYGECGWGGTPVKCVQTNGGCGPQPLDIIPVPAATIPLSSTCGCRGSGAGASLSYPESRGPGCGTPAAGITNLCHRAGHIQLVVAGGLVPLPPAAYPPSRGGRASHPGHRHHQLMPGARHLQLVVAGGRVPAPLELTLKTVARVQHPGRRRHQLMQQGPAFSTCG